MSRRVLGFVAPPALRTATREAQGAFVADARRHARRGRARDGPCVTVSGALPDAPCGRGQAIGQTLLAQHTRVQKVTKRARTFPDLPGTPPSPLYSIVLAINVLVAVTSDYVGGHMINVTQVTPERRG
jgi:hypothetical protein